MLSGCSQGRLFYHDPGRHRLRASTHCPVMGSPPPDAADTIGDRHMRLHANEVRQRRRRHDLLVLLLAHRRVAPLSCKMPDEIKDKDSRCGEGKGRSTETGASPMAPLASDEAAKVVSGRTSVRRCRDSRCQRRKIWYVETGNARALGMAVRPAETRGRLLAIGGKTPKGASRTAAADGSTLASLVLGTRWFHRALSV